MKLLKKLEPRPFEWMMKHQEALDALKEELSTAPVLGYDVPISQGNLYWTQIPL